MKTIAIFVHQPACSVDSANGIITALSPQYSFKLFSKDQVEDTFFDDVDCVCVPGGIGDADRFDSLMKYNYDTVRDYVNQGGRYLGICMGAYWASHYYFDLLKDIRAEQYITRPGADTRRPHAKNQRVLWCGQEENMFFYDGCALVGSSVDTTKIWSLYPNGDAMAVIQDNIGVIGCHPESESHWYQNYSWMQGKYHNGLHHQLLLNFVDDLMSSSLR